MLMTQPRRCRTLVCMKPEDEKKMMELLERDLVKRLEKRYGHEATVRKDDEVTQARRSASGSTK